MDLTHPPELGLRPLVGTRLDVFSRAVILRVETVVGDSLAHTRERVLAYLTAHQGAVASTNVSDDQRAVLRRVGVAAVSKEILVETLSPTETEHRVIIPMRWSATGAGSGLFPTLDANVELHAVGPASTRIAVVGSYLPPLGRTGEYLDRVVLREVAQSSVRRFLTRMVEAAGVPAVEAGA